MIQQTLQFAPAAHAMLHLRDYQTQGINNVLHHWARGTHNVLGVAGTGAGKTVMFAEVLNRSRFGRALVLVDTNALADQTVRRLAKRPELWPVEKFSGSVEPSTRVLVAVVDQLQASFLIRAIGKIDILIIDEAHAAVTAKFWTVIQNLKIINPSLRMLGVTATAIREDGRSLGQVFDALAFHFPIDWLIREGWLVRPVGRAYTVADAHTGEQVSVLGHAQAPAFIFGKWVKEARGRKTLGYTTTVAEARNLAHYFTHQGVPAAYIHGRQSARLQQDIEQGFRDGRYQVVFNALLWTQGMDFPDVSCIILARRFESQLLFIQCVGRGLRLNEGKEDCIVLGFHPDGMHSLVQTGNIFRDEKPIMPTRIPPEYRQTHTRQLAIPRPNIIELVWHNAVETAYDLMTGRDSEGNPFGIVDLIKRIFRRDQ